MIDSKTTTRTPNLRFSEFEEDWSVGNLGQLIDTLDAGVSVNSGDKPATRGKKGILKTSCVTSGEFRPIENKIVHDEVEINRLKEPVRAKTIIISRMNTPALVGANAYIQSDYPNLFLPDRLWAAKVNIDHNPKWVSILTSSIRIRKIFSARGTGTSGSMKNIKKSDVLTIPINFPKKNEQQKIAVFLTSINEKLNKLRLKRKLLKTYKHGLMQKLFSQEIRFKQKDGSDFPDWEEKILSDVLTLNLREVDKPIENYLAIGIRSHMKGTFQKPHSEPGKIAMDKLYVVREGDLVVNITFAWEGAIAIVRPEDDRGLVSHRFPTYSFKKDKVSKEYFQHIISQKRFKFCLAMISPGGAGRNRVMNKRDFLKIEWNFPSAKEQIKIADFLASFDQKLSGVELKIKQLETFKKGLIQQMFV